jgi:hypothetical protein
MGVWGAGLYSSDFAMDLRSAIRAIARLPFDGEKLLEILSETVPTVADNPNEEDHTTFWLVVADQFTKRAIICDRARKEALTIIDADSDLAMHARLGMNASDLSKRRKMLQDVRGRLTAPPISSRPRSVLRKPQTFLMDVGDLLVYPTCGGRCVNPYFASKEQDRTVTATGWKQDGWSALVIVDRGRAFDFLSWYRPLTLATATVEKPTFEGLRGDVLWKLERAGTCSPVHFKRMELEKIATLSIDNDRLRRLLPVMPPGTVEAIEDISLANAMNVGRSAPAVRVGKPSSTILGIAQLLSG